MKTGVYRHWKGNDYLVIGVAEDEDGKEFVVYSRLYKRDGNPLRLRPLSEFNQEVSPGMKRFVYVEAP